MDSLVFCNNFCCYIDYPIWRYYQGIIYPCWCFWVRCCNCWTGFWTAYTESIEGGCIRICSCFYGDGWCVYGGILWERRTCQNSEKADCLYPYWFPLSQCTMSSLWYTLPCWCKWRSDWYGELYWDMNILVSSRTSWFCRGSCWILQSLCLRCSYTDAYMGIFPHDTLQWRRRTGQVCQVPYYL